ncbi:uncharacterized protein LOC144704407 [Wolffia australiana]
MPSAFASPDSCLHRSSPISRLGIRRRKDASSGRKRKAKKRSSVQRGEDDDALVATMEKDTSLLDIDGTDGTFDPNEPTMGEKLAGLSPVGNDQLQSSAQERDASAIIKPPSADSVHLLLKQVLRAEDHTLLLNCLYTKDEQLIKKSVSSLNPSDVLKLLDSLLSMVQSRGAVLVCCIPWLRTLLVHHASSIISHPSSPSTLNTLYQLIDSRVLTFGSALRLSACLDDVFAGVMDLDDGDEEEEPQPVIF